MQHYPVVHQPSYLKPDEDESKKSASNTDESNKSESNTDEPKKSASNTEPKDSAQNTGKRRDTLTVWAFIEESKVVVTH